MRKIANTMIIQLCFLGAFIFYSIAASLPFLGLSEKLHYVSAMVIALFTSYFWTTISRNIDKNSVVIYGAWYDAMLTLAFLLIPLLFTGFNLTPKQAIGIVIMLLGILITKF